MPQTNTQTMPSAGQLQARVIAGALVIIFAMWGLAGFSALSLRHTAIDDAHAQAANLAAAFNSDVAARLDTLSASMNYIAAEMRAHDGKFDLYTWAKGNPIINGAATRGVIIGPDGYMAASSESPSPQKIDLSDRAHFRIHLDHPDTGLFIGAPVMSRVLDKPEIVVPISIRVDSADGRFLGVVSLLAANLSKIYNSVDIGARGVITLVGLDNIVRARVTQGAKDTDPHIGQSVNGLNNGTIGPNGTGRMIKVSVDNVTRLYSYHRVHQYPLVVAVGLDLDQALARARSTYIIIFAFAAAATIITVFFAIFLIRAIRHRMARGIALTKANLQLAESEKRADAANQAKSLFLANMSHELRTPLNAIIGFSEIIKDAKFGPLALPRYRDYANDILNSGQYLLNLVTSVLDISKIEAKKFTLNEDLMDANAITRDSIATVKLAAEARGIKIELKQPSYPAIIRGDAIRLRQVLTNLLSNAVKFSHDDGLIDVSLSVDTAKGIVYTVTDHGIGMTPAEIFIAFEPFSQVDNELNKLYPGTGLGLPLAKRLTEMHGGVLDLHSRRGLGTTVTITLPADRIVGDVGFPPLRAA